MKKGINNLDDQLSYLQMNWLKLNYKKIISEAVNNSWDYLECFSKLIDGQVHQRMHNGVQKKIKSAGFPVIKSIDQFDWTWPDSINEHQIKHLFRLGFLENKANVVFIGTVGLGKSHLAIALGYAACNEGVSVLFTSAAKVIDNLISAQEVGMLNEAIKKYAAPSILILDELGFMPIDKQGSDFLFRVISQRYEKGSTIITTNKAYKDWATIFNNDATITAAILDRLLHHVETVIIKGKSYRMKDHL